MKQFFSIALALSLVFSGCTKVPGVAADNKIGGSSSSTTSKTVVSKAPVTPVAFTPETRSLVSPEEIPLLEQINQENIRVANAATPSIVRITATRQADPHMQFFGKDSPFHFSPKNIPPSHSFELNEPSYGSGVIISKDGYIVTNNHVTEDARDIQVQLQDKSSYPARIVASDMLVDVAVLKIDASNLPALPWGDSDKVQVGEQVFAIGNPFNLEDSVSKGIVSAKGRNLPGSRNYENFIQTDAAINPGNSGGALINIHGELIGLNAAIASISRFNMGVGFAIPSNLVRYAVDGLLKEGKLVRGYLGVRLPETIDDGTLNELNLKSDQGALLSGVQPGSPADIAKLRPFDFIMEVDGHKISNTGDLRLIVSQIPIGKEVEVKYIRDGAPQSTQIKISETPHELLTQVAPDNNKENTDQAPQSNPQQPEVSTVLSGLQVADLDDKTRQKLGLGSGVKSGVVVSNVEEGSPADKKSIQKGDMIERACVNRGPTQEITSAKDFTDMAKNLKPGQSVVLLVHHNKAGSFVFLAPSQ
jgi:serine protease Do